jgi:N-acetylglucosaminyl-diphospho-decaprenol L-rhamnosyltransferase
LSTDDGPDARADDASQWAAVIVNYESGEHLAACVASVRADRSAGPPEVLVVDNGSRDGSLATLARTFPDVRVVASGANVGYGAGANRGIAATRAGIVAVCNPDIEVRPGSAAAMLVRFEREPDLAALGPLMENPDGTQYPSARSVPSTVDAIGHAVLGSILPQNAFTRRYRQLDVDPSRPRDVEWLSGAAMWIRRSAIDSIGGWDEHYFMYTEDLDLCWRLRRLGWRVAYEPRARVTHVQGVSTDRHPYRMIVHHHRSVYRFATKRWHGARRVLLAPTMVLLSVRAAFAIVARAFGARRGRLRVRR